MLDQETLLQQLRLFFDKPACVVGVGPLRKGIEIAITVDASAPLTLKKEAHKMAIVPGAPAKPDMTFEVPAETLNELVLIETEEVGEIGIAILKAMAHSEPAKKNPRKGPYWTSRFFLKRVSRRTSLGWYHRDEIFSLKRFYGDSQNQRGDFAIAKLKL